MNDLISAHEVFLLAAGGFVGVAYSELWRLIRAPEELAIMRRVETMLSKLIAPTPAPGSLAAANEAAFRPLREGMARHDFWMRRARIANLGVWASLAATFYAGAHDAMTAANILCAAFLACAVISIWFHRQANRAIDHKRMFERKVGAGL
jgi:hypothetical protein